MILELSSQSNCWNDGTTACAQYKLLANSLSAETWQDLD